ncbi:XrtA/PEP-CTERM system TPR-repeat protein PrsT [Pelomonas sp. Root1444]|uniref:XrtA/PEP-CTERM system TPR-repeat protein PrsT n=1 Tax=Pelomonas sp. Root1444 TaxID=1736464 RepID=UPI0009E95A85|nr:XrtA/PEP-CTERM system TPR-repeat protein PrsT [Pelomonas sp. Root1444]
MSNISKSTLLVCALAASVALTACSGKSPAQLLASGKASMQKRDFNAATIEFKNVLQQDATNAEARFLLGKSLFEMGRPSEALVELGKAREAGYPVGELAPMVGAAMMLRGEADKFIAEYAAAEVSEPKAKAEVKAALATAYGVKGKYQQSREAAEAALQADPGNVTAQLLIAQLLRVAGDYAGAMAQIERTIQTAPKSGAPWLAKAEQLVQTNGDATSAVAAYREALRLMPDNLRAHLGLIQELIRQRDFDGAQRQLALLEKLQPKGLQGRYFATMLAYERRDLKTAFESAQELLRVAPDNARFLQLAGAIEYERGSYLQAIAHLGKALPSSPSPVAVRVLMSRAQLRAGDPAKALSFLQPLLDGDRRAPAEVYSLAADCYLQQNDGEAAKKMYAKAVELNPDDARGRTVLALSQLNEGRSEQGMADLKSIAGSTAGGEAEVAMITAHIQGNRLDEALTVIDALERKQADKPLAPYFRGRVQQLQGQRDKARASFEQAVARQASYAPAVTALALLDLDDGKPANAAARYEKLVAAAPQDVGARLGLVAARARAGAKPEEVRNQLEEAVKLFPESDLPRLTLVGTLLDRGDFNAALKAAQDGVARFPKSAGLIQAQGLAELALGSHNQAAQSFSKAAALQPNSVDPLMHMANVQMARKDMPAAIAQLRKVLAMKPDHLPAQARLVTLLARSGKADEAMSVAKNVQKQLPNEPSGWLLEGDLLAMKGNRTGAVVALKTAFAKRASDETAIKLHNALMAASQTAEADKLGADWLAKRPQSPAFNFYLGEQSIGRRDYERAEQYYRTVMATQPDNAVVLNNLAWLLHRSGKPGALEMGEKALALAPDSEAVLDTVAEIHAGAGRMDKALTLQKRAVERSPAMPVLRLHLAQYLIKNGHKSEARAELDRLTAMGSGFAAQEEVQKLLASL